MYQIYLDSGEASGGFSFKFETIEEATKFMDMLFKYYDDKESDYTLIFTLAKK